MTMKKKKDLKLPSPDEMLKKCNEVIALVTALKTIVSLLVPPELQKMAVSFVQSRLGKASTSEVSIIVEDRDLTGRSNPVYEDLMLYFGSKILETGTGNRIRVSREPGVNEIALSIVKDGDLVHRDELEGINLICKYDKVERHRDEPTRLYGNDFFEIKVAEEHKEFALKTYIPHVAKIAAKIRNENKVLSVHTNSATQRWDKMRLLSTSSFATMALSKDVRSQLINDLERFVSRREYYKKVGKAWKRGYLFYGPPGTGKSSLVAAIANHLKFDIYELQLSMVTDDSSMRKLLLNVGNGSLLVFEDIDRSVKLGTKDTGLSLAGVLNCIDGIWSSCGEERIIVFTTNNKEEIDPALLRPGRMDVHIHMGYCTFDGFKTLSSNYLGLEEHARFPQVEELLKGDVITPAEVAEEFMKMEEKSLAIEKFIAHLQVMRSRKEGLGVCS